jgi:DNA-directed RNA polymerase II subunit RPB2
LRNTTELKNEDVYNNGGYFIIKGKERVIVAQERINYNQIYIYKQKNKYRYVAEIRSIKESADYSVLLQSKILNDGKIVFTIPYITQDIPIPILFIALGSNMDFLLDHCADDTLLYQTIQSSFQQYLYMSQENCIEFISSFTVNKIDETRKIAYTKNILKNEILPHFSTCIDIQPRIIFLLKMISKLIHTDNGSRIEDDRDHICNKRIEMVGDLLANLINSLFKRSIKSMQQYIEKREDMNRIEDLNIINVINRCNITQRLYYCFTTGNWGLPKSNYIRQGVSQILSRLSYLGTVSHLRRVIVPIGKESRNTQVRQIHATNYGFVDPIETPEGQQVGIIRNFSILTKVSNKISTTYVIDIIDRLFVVFKRTFRISNNFYCIFINGIWIGSITKRDTQIFIDHFKRYRSFNIIPDSVSIGIDHLDREININTDSGRLLRPVFNIDKIDQIPSFVKKHTLKDLWNVLLEENIILYIDGNEAESSVIAMRPENILSNTIKYDYCEIHPCLMLGICSATTPFPEHSQNPRNVYVAAMMKQAIGMYAYSHNERFDTIAHVLHYPQKKLVTTKIAEYTHCEDMPSGSEVILAVMCYTGLNVEPLSPRKR